MIELCRWRRIRGDGWTGGNQPRPKVRSFREKNDVEHAIQSSLSCFVGCSQAASPRQASPGDSHGLSQLLRSFVRRSPARDRQAIHRTAEGLLPALKDRVFALYI